ncbi:hypothetical protein EVAR_22497_1 [Eumeta japonica]|uniref:Uncharacterized protein n=1 Tax=Eumeta variegata TaxID=151549 RepID=A0A4C1ZA40_EUMVA|nr:hypothetical protein EVAR_22497_1 [Eumeta japonica]
MRPLRVVFNLHPLHFPATAPPPRPAPTPKEPANFNRTPLLPFENVKESQPPAFRLPKGALAGRAPHLATSTAYKDGQQVNTNICSGFIEIGNWYRNWKRRKDGTETGKWTDGETMRHIKIRIKGVTGVEIKRSTITRIESGNETEIASRAFPRKR